MSYFNPTQEINSIFLDFQQQEYYYCSDTSKVENLKLQSDLNFQIQELALDIFDSNLDREEKFEEPDQGYNSGLQVSKGRKSRYQKNICGYIVKKILRAFICTSYRKFALEVCKKFAVEFEEISCFCLQKMQKLNGISCLYSVFMPGRRQDIESRLALIDFTQWFVKERYLRHLILEGKMRNKQSYIHFKNKLFPKEINSLKLEIAIYKQELRYRS